jgi:sporulation protein YlmC with PRC-barrel domain
MRLELGCPVSCTDGPVGELADVVIDPVSRRVTHLVVQPHGQGDRARLVAAERASPEGAGVGLDIAAAEFEALEFVRTSEYLRVGQMPVTDPDWEVGVTDFLSLPVYQEMDGLGTAIVPDPHEVVSYDRIPRGEAEIRRSSSVISSDGHRVGHVDGFLVGEGLVADIVLDQGHLWGKREVVIPAAAVAKIETDTVTLDLTKDEVGALPGRRVHRWS